MGRRTRLAVVIPAAVAVLGLATVPAVAAPADPPAKPQAEKSTGEPLGHAIGNAGTLLGVIRALPGASGLGKLPLPIPGLPDLSGGGKGLLSLGFGLSSAKTNSEADNPKTAAEASPFGVSLFGNAPTVPGSVSQTAPPDNKTPTTGGFDIPENPLISGSLLKSSAHARYSDKLGPCVDPIGEGKSSVADLKLLPILPRLEGLPDLKNLGELSKLLDLTKLGGTQQTKAKEADELTGPFASLLGMLGGVPGLQDALKDLPGLPPGLPGLPQLPGLGEDGGAVLSLPETLSTQSTVRLVPIKGSKNKAVQSTSKLQVASLRLLEGTPFELRVDVVSKPTLQVTSTGEKKTSKVTYTAPILKIYQGGKLVYQLDATKPSVELPMTLLPIGNGGLSLAQAEQLLKAIPGLPQAVGMNSVNREQTEKLAAVPVIGELPQIPGLPSLDQLNDLNLGVIRLAIAHKEDTGVEKVKGKDKAPFTGYEIGSTARLLNLEVLPSSAMNTAALPELPGLPGLNGPLAQVALGEQVAKAYAPKGGVVCGVSKPEPPSKKPPKDQASPPPPLAYTDAAYQTVPMLWTGAGLVLAGAVLVGFKPLRRKLVAIRNRKDSTLD